MGSGTAANKRTLYNLGPKISSNNKFKESSTPVHRPPDPRCPLEDLVRTTRMIGHPIGEVVHIVLLLCLKLVSRLGRLLEVFQNFAASRSSPCAWSSTLNSKRLRSKAGLNSHEPFKQNIGS